MSITSKNAELITAEDVAELLSVKKSWVYDNHVNLGIPSIKLGHLVRFRRVDVLDWVASRAEEVAA